MKLFKLISLHSISFILGALCLWIIQGCSSARVIQNDNRMEITVKYNAGNWVNPMNVTEVISFPRRDGIILPNDIKIIRNNGMGFIDISGGYVWSWNNKYEIRLLTGKGESLNRYPANGVY